MIKFTVPLYIVKEFKTKKPKNVYINMNNYRNWNRFMEHDVKVAYESIVKDQLSLLAVGKLDTPIIITYTLFVGDKRIKDTNNILSIVDKYVSDGLVRAGYIEDDNYNFIVDTSNRFAAYEQGAGRVQVCIYSVNNYDDMKAFIDEKIDIYLKKFNKDS